LEEEGVIPAGALDLAPGRARSAIGAQDVEGEAPQPGEVFRGIVLAGPGPILVEDHVEAPSAAGSRSASAPAPPRAGGRR
jgi:hypothetical protein